MIEINLLGKKVKEKRSISMPSFDFSFGGSDVFILLLAVILVIEIVFLGLMTLKMNNKVELLTQKRNKLKSVEREVKSIRKELKQINLKIDTIKKLKQNRGRAYKILENIANVLPSQGIWLTKLSKNGSSIILEGKSFSTEVVAAYMTNLENLKTVSKVRFRGRGLVRLSKARDLYGFYITVTIK